MEGDGVTQREGGRNTETLRWQDDGGGEGVGLGTTAKGGSLCVRVRENYIYLNVLWIKVSATLLNK